MSSEQYDVIIIGGGMVGATVACCLAGSGLRIALVEARQPAPFSPSAEHDLRVSALSQSSRTILEMLGVWSSIAGMRACPFRRMQVWENRGRVEFSGADIGAAEMGFIVENRVVQLALLEHLESLPDVTLFCPAQPQHIRYGAEQSVVVLADGSEIRGRLLVAADGGQSRVRQVSGIGVSSKDFGQHALVISVRTACPQQDVTWQRFRASGPQAFLPLSGPNASLVWYNVPDEVRRLGALPDDVLLEEIQQAFPENLGRLDAVLAHASFPLRSQHALEYVKPGVALVGDAAHMINPLAGQGVNIGLLDAAALAEVLLNAHHAGDDFGSLQVLRRYQQMRRADNQIMMSAMEFFYRLFSNENRPLQVLRNAGLGLADRLVPAKTLVMRYAMGLEGSLPRLAKGHPIL